MSLAITLTFVFDLNIIIHENNFHLPALMVKSLDNGLVSDGFVSQYGSNEEFLKT